MNETTDRDLSLDDFDLSLLKGGPLNRILPSLGITHQFKRHERILLFVLSTWGMSALLTMYSGDFLNPRLSVPYAYDFAELIRFALVGPILIFAEVIIDPWLAHVVTHFRRFVASEDLPKLKEQIARAAIMRDSVLVDVLLISFAFVRPHFGMPLELSSEITSWSYHGIHVTPAMQYTVYVARPLIILLWLRWMWKYVIWCLLLCRIASLNLATIPSHPDRSAGLGFVTSGHTKFGIIAFAFGLQASASIGEFIVFEGATLDSMKYLILGTLIINLMIFITPLFAFTPKLLECKRRGLFEYGALADEYVEAFHNKWIKGQRGDGDPLLGFNDVQSLADLSTSFDVVREMKPSIVTKGAVIAFALAVLAPFAPLLLTVYRLDELIQRAWQVVL